MRFTGTMSFVLFVMSFIGAGYAAATTIPNELGAPRAGGLPRESSTAYEIIYGSVRVGSDIQRVIVTKPFGSGPYPALLMVGGIGCYSMDFSGNGPKPLQYQTLLDFVARQGYVTMRVEKTGMGDSQGAACKDQDFKREVAGYLAGLQALKAYSFVDSHRVSIFGHSIGGVIAPFLAAEVPVKSVAVIGTLATDWATYDIANVRRQYALGGVTGDELELRVAQTKLVAIEFYKNKKSPEQIISEHPEVTDALKQEYEGVGVSPDYMQQLGDIMPATDWTRSSASVIILSGASDFIAPQYDELVPMVQQVNAKRANPIHLLNILNLDHFFTDAATEEESYNQKHNDGSALKFQDDLLRVLKTQLLN